MSERLSERLARISTEAEAMANAVAAKRNKYDHGPAHEWRRWDSVYQWADGIMSDADEARQWLREHPDMDLDL